MTQSNNDKPIYGKGNT